MTPCAGRARRSSRIARKIISFSPPAFSRAPSLFRGCRRAFLGAFGRGFLAGLGAFFALGRRFAFLALFLLFLDHLDVAGGRRGAFSRGDFFLRARQRHGHHRDVFVTDNFNAGRRLDFTEVNGLAEFEMADINRQSAPANPWAGSGP
jgi:hypothetical protein